MAKKSLAAETTEIALPKTTALAPTDDVIESLPPPYFGFASNKSDKFVELVQSGIRDGDPYLSSGGKATKLDPLKFHLLHYKQFWTECDDKLEVLGVRTTDPNSFKSPYKEHFEVAVLVYSPTGLVAARATMRTTKAPAAKKAAKELKAAATAGWASESDEHRVAAGLPEAWARFTATVSLTKKTAKGSGFAFYLANASVRPTTSGEWGELQKYLGDEENRAKLDAVVEAYNSRVSDLLEKVK